MFVAEWTQGAGCPPARERRHVVQLVGSERVNGGSGAFGELGEAEGSAGKANGGQARSVSEQDRRESARPVRCGDKADQLCRKPDSRLRRAFKLEVERRIHLPKLFDAPNGSSTRQRLRRAAGTRTGNAEVALGET